ncbi:MAG TPA: site-specific integrase [Chitinophagales bacterium]|nr:site-specific integrase [Chitinophagales bacterium]
MEKAPKLKVVLFTSKTLKNGEHPVMFRLTKDRKAKYIATGYSSKTTHWDGKNNKPKSKHPKQIELETYLMVQGEKMQRGLMELFLDKKTYSVEQATNKVKGARNKKSVKAYFDEVIQDEKAKGSIRTSNAYKQTRNVLFTFYTKADLQFSEMDYSLLTKFESFLKQRKAKDNTLIFYFKTIRALYNKAQKEGLIRSKDSPFKDFSISKFDKTTQHRALQETEIEKIKALKLEHNTPIWHTRNLFLFSYYSMGMNYTDVSHLTWDNIISTSVEGKEVLRVVYERAKTGRKFNLKLVAGAVKILNEYRELQTDKYIFPVIHERADTALKMYNRVM